MQIVQAPRASTILYSLLQSQENQNPWLLPANICPIVPITFFKAGVPFEFVDISAQTLHMDLEQAEGRLKWGGYGGVLYAHTYGEPSTPVEFFQAIKSKYPDVMLIDDRCLCIPNLEPPTNTFVDAILYSTGYAKIVELNFGGYAFLKEGTSYRPQHLPFDPQAYEEIEQGYKQSIQIREPYVYVDNDWLQTEADLPTWYDYRQQIEEGLKASLHQRATLTEIYATCLPAEIKLPWAYQTWRFNIRVKDKDRILEKIFSAGLFASSHYASLAGVIAPGRCLQAESLADEVINLFNDHNFSLGQAKRVCALIMETPN